MTTNSPGVQSAVLTELDHWFQTEILVHEPALMRFLARSWSNHNELDDIRQEIYVAVYEAASRGLPRLAKAYLFKTARHLLIDRVRRRRVVSIEAIGGWEELDDLNIVGDEPSSETKANARQELNRLALAFDELPQRCREVLWLRRVEDLPQGRRRAAQCVRRRGGKSTGACGAVARAENSRDCAEAGSLAGRAPPHPTSPLNLCTPRSGDLRGWFVFRRVAGRNENVMQKTDYEQIQELTARYAAAIDAKNYDAIEQCFTPDASVEYQGYSEALVGRAAIVAHMRRSLDGLDGTQHLFTNFVIDGEGDTARLNCDILAHHWRAAATGGTTFMAGGKYSVELKRLDGRWHFARLRGRTAWSEGNRNLLPRTG